MQASRLRRSSMGKLVLLVVFLAASFPVLAADKTCLISFDSAVLNVCSGQVQAVDPTLADLAEVTRYASSEYRVVKFDQNVGRAQREAIERVGGTILGYVPHHAYLVRLPAAMASAAAAIEGVVWTGPYLPIWKLDINLARDLATDAGARQETNIIREAGIEQLVIGLHAGAQRDAVLGRIQSLAGLSLDLTFSGFDGERLLLGFERELLFESVIALAAEDAVASVSLHWPNDFMNSQAPGLHQSGTISDRPIYDQGLFGCGQIIGAADSGLHATHCSFSDTDYGQPVTSVCPSGTSCAAVTPDFDHRKIGAHYKWDGSTSGGPADNQGHGTHVIGSILGNNPAAPVDCEAFTTPGGVSNLDGTAPGAKLISQEMGASLQYLNSLGGTIYHAATVAYENGARIHNNSWGSSCRNQFGQCIAGCEVEYRQTTRDADAAVWEFPELAIFFAAGNSGGLGGSAGCGVGTDVGAAGNGKNVFSIGSNNRGTAGNNMSGFSSRGPTQDRRSKPDMTAQGASIVSASRSACGTVGNSGTSMATPTAAGLAALVREYLARGFYPLGTELAAFAIPDPSAALIKAIMINGAQEITGTGTTGGSPSQSQGWGRVHLNNALFFDGDDRRLWLVDGKDGLETDDVDHRSLNVEAGQPLIVTLTWHDAPAKVNANPHSVNRLRLEVETPSGEVWTQKLSPGGGLTDPNPFQASSAGDYDDANNVHQIRFDNPAAGTYLVRVRGIQVAEGPQPYALAATGDLLGVGDPDFLLSSAPSQLAECRGEDASYVIGVRSEFDFDDDVTLSVTAGLPAGTTPSFTSATVTPADPPATSVLTIANTGGVDAGSYTVELTGQSSGPDFDPVTKTINIGLRIDEDLQGPTLLAPANGVVDIGLSPTFNWAEQSGAVEYRIQISSDAGFGMNVYDEVVDEASFVPSDELATGSEYFWRVSGNNQCGQGEWSETFSFTTRLEPVADFSASEFDLEVPQGSVGNAMLEISNIGTGNLTWEIETDQIDGLRGGHDSDLDETLNVPDFTIDSPANGGSPEVFVIPAGVATRGEVIGFSFSGDVTGVSGNQSWASDMCLRVTAPDGTTFEVGGFSAAIESCAVNTWDFDGSGSSSDGSYASEHLDVFDPAVEDEGDWTFRFVNGWDSTAAATMNWTNVTITLHKAPLPVCGEELTNVDWLSVSPASGSVPADESDDVTVQVNTAGLDEGDYEGYLCVITNAENAPVTPIRVAMVVTEAVLDPPVIGVDPTELSIALDEGDQDSLSFMIGNAGEADLVWQLDQSTPQCQLPGWLGVTPTGASVAGGDEQTVNVDFDTDGLAPGGYEASICLSSNDPVTPLWSLPVWMAVGDDELFQDRFEEN